MGSRACESTTPEATSSKSLTNHIARTEHRMAVARSPPRPNRSTRSSPACKPATSLVVASRASRLSSTVVVHPSRRLPPTPPATAVNSPGDATPVTTRHDVEHDLLRTHRTGTTRPAGTAVQPACQRVSRPRRHLRRLDTRPDRISPPTSPSTRRRQQGCDRRNERGNSGAATTTRPTSTRW